MSGRIKTAVLAEVERVGFGRTVADIAAAVGLLPGHVGDALVKLAKARQIRSWAGAWTGVVHYARKPAAWPSRYRMGNVRHDR